MRIARKNLAFAASAACVAVLFPGISAAQSGPGGGGSGSGSGNDRGTATDDRSGSGSGHGSGSGGSTSGGNSGSSSGGERTGYDRPQDVSSFDGSDSSGQGRSDRRFDPLDRF